LTGALQWGHGEFAVDDNSNNPLGNLWNALLQWGHGEFAVDDFGAFLVALPVFMLQWGHGEFAVDDDKVSFVKVPPSSRFNGATANSPWMTAGRLSESNQKRYASMGPRRIRRG